MSTLEIADIFRAGFESYVQTMGALPMDHYKTAHAIMACRTEELGGHVYKCDRCGHERTLHNSCGNRHCPKCQSLARAQWVQARIGELLPVPYFHAVFTLPAELNPFLLRNKTAGYALLFRCVRETLSELSADTKLLGARTGFILVLHSWGQNLMDHPHIHCIIPGGGLDGQAGVWKNSRNRFLFPVAVMSALFKGKFMHGFRQAVRNKSIGLHGLLGKYEDPGEFQKLVNGVYGKRWVIYVKPPFAGPEAVVRYLGNYTHRIAISNYRILSFENNRVTFSWRDYADHNKKKKMTVSVHEFIRRFLLHVVPNGFMRIRHYGILGNRCKAKLLPLCRKLIEGESVQKADPVEKRAEKKKAWHEVIMEMTGTDPRICPCCKKGIMVIVGEIPEKKRQWLSWP